ncbi:MULTISPECIES: hypothetical protein [Acinetobacter]|uniref:MBL fold metallo-hydrolase n=1 Tax=Acinetobacter pseudolwoffii TaxID=2053287 RepID=A0A2H9UNL3_9GAMM|nr:MULTISPECIES: hypothetical protein [Acinetobacter]ENU30781.1 hypothetical protein F991_01295 [Acinetobacter sp. CIP-A165]NAR70602.1 hypothetical protein [Acinetobacter haemolyticus]PJI33240.1 hypothetical protein CU320_04585 [Acinetobacter pseudolwoffii]RSB50573.1 hypothetical protein EGK59_16160 [Acinetobacter soli]
MQIEHKVIFYPVGNGDTSQIILNNGRRILMDYRHQKKGENTSEPVIDLKTRLKKELDDADRDYFDVVAFTHADDDHICGSTEFFELEFATKYQGNGRIKISELWVPAAMLLEKTDNDHRSDEFVILRQEARHRLLEGEGIRVFSKPSELTDWLSPKLKERGESSNARDHLFVDAGTLVPTFSLFKDGVEFFCHSPFIKHCAGGDIVRNQASLIFNIRFNADDNIYDYLAVGDADSCDLDDIVSITKYHQNDDRLAWDLFNIPHHCSYKALNAQDKGVDETDPTPLVQELLEMGKADAYLVSSSHPIRDDKDSYRQVQPPHIQAYNTYNKYLKKIKGRKFLVTMQEPNEQKPEPLTFEVTSGGISFIRTTNIGAPSLITSVPPRAGNDDTRIF